MKRERNNKHPRKTAAELMSELQRDPAFVDRERAREEEQHENIKKYSEAAKSLLDALSTAGFPIASVRELRQQGQTYHAAVPVLLEWLPRISDPQVKEDVVRTLSVPWAGPSAARILIEEFKRADDPIGTGLRWAIANALEVLAGDDDFEAINELVRQRGYGKAREMLTLSLGNMTQRGAVDTLTELLEDEEVVGHAVMALGRLKAHAARRRIEALAQHPTAWIRREVKRALNRIGSADAQES